MVNNAGNDPRVNLFSEGCRLIQFALIEFDYVTRARKFTLISDLIAYHNV